MKTVFTIVFLFFCLKLSAAIPCIDTVKPANARHAGDTPKTTAPLVQDSSKLKAGPGHSDTIRTAASAFKKDSTTILAAANPKDSVKQSPVLKSDNVAIAAAGWFYVLPSVTYVKPFISTPEEPEDKNPPILSMIQLDSLKNTVIQEQIRQENLRKMILRNEQIKLAEVLKINNLDSLKQQLKVTASDTVKALIYTRIALKYMDYDTLSDPGKQLRYQNAAINYTLLAIHEYSTYNDSAGLRDAFSHLAGVYTSQKKYTEAKWFILQSNTLSRATKDTPNIISSLLTLASIKSDIKDYNLAMGDLNEALRLAIDHHAPKTEVDVLKNYALLYSTLQDYPKEAMVLKKRDSILYSIRKSDEAQLAKAAAFKKRQDLLNKKKLLLANSRKPSKSNSPAKMASL